MARFVVFLRAINVGGHSVAKAKLQEAFISLGYQNVLTYKQSGNVIFETDEADASEIKEKSREDALQGVGLRCGSVCAHQPTAQSNS